MKFSAIFLALAAALTVTALPIAAPGAGSLDAIGSNVGSTLGSVVGSGNGSGSGDGNGSGSGDGVRCSTIEFDNADLA